MRSLLIRTFLFVVLTMGTLCSSTSFAQGYDWARGLGNSLSTVRKMVFDNQGNLLCLVYYFDSIHHDRTYYARGESDVALLKFSPKGEPLWGVSFGGYNAEDGISMACDSFGYTYIKIHSISNRIFDSANEYPGHPGGRLFLFRFGSNGKLIQIDSTTGNGIGTQPFRGFMESNRNGSVIMLDWCDGDSVVYQRKRIDRGYFISSPSFGWAYPWHTGIDHVIPKALAARRDEGFYVASDFSVATYYHPTPKTVWAQDSLDVLLEWYGPSSYLQAYTTFGGPTDDRVLAMKLDSKGQIYSLVSHLDSLVVDDTVVEGNTRRSNVLIQSSIGSFPHGHKVSSLFEGELGSASLAMVSDTGFSAGGLISDSLVIGGTQFLPEENKAKLWTATFNERGNVMWAGPPGDTNSLFATTMIARDLNRIYLSGLFGYRFQYSRFKQPVLSPSPAVGFVASIEPTTIVVTHDSTYCLTTNFILTLSPSDSVYSGNWVVELSTSNGSFENPRYPPFTLLSPNTLSVQLDGFVSNSNSYRLRVHRLSPAASGIPTKFYIGTLPTPAITTVGQQLRSNYATGNQWYLDSQQIDGATDRYYTPTVSGDYQVEVTNQVGCSKLSKEFSFVRSSVTSKLDVEDVLVRGTDVTFNLPGIYTLELTDLLGRAIATRTFEATERDRSIDLRSLALTTRQEALIMKATCRGRSWILKVIL